MNIQKQILLFTNWATYITYYVNKNFYQRASVLYAQDFSVEQRCVPILICDFLLIGFIFIYIIANLP